MEGRSVILSVLVMSLVMAQIQVEAKSCCPSLAARNAFKFCRFAQGPERICASTSGCILVKGSSCPGTYANDILENSADAVNEYCKLGCTSSVCGPMITLQNTDAREIVNGAVEKCENACSAFCTKGSNKTALTEAA